MLKKMIITIIVIVITISFCACSKSESSSEVDSAEKSIVVEEVQSTQKVTTAPTDEPESEITSEPHIDNEFIKTYLEDGEIVFMEDTKDMNANNGREFGEISKKQIGNGGYEFTFEPNTNEHLPLIKHLDEFEDAIPLGNQAVYVRFNTTTASIYFSFLGDNDFGIYFGDKGQPLVFTYTESNPFSFDGDLKLEADKWYNLFMAMDKNGDFNCIIYLDDDSDNPTTAKVILGETASGEDYKNQSWQFEIATHEEGTVTIEHYDVYTYGMFIDK